MLPVNQYNKHVCTKPETRIYIYIRKEMQTLNRYNDRCVERSKTNDHLHFFYLQRMGFPENRKSQPNQMAKKNFFFEPDNEPTWMGNCVCFFFLVIFVRFSPAA